jgi:nucleotide-binding universal stress UspA family protein
VIDPVTDTTDVTETQVHRWHLDRLRRWASGLDLQGHQASFHVVESGDVAGALVAYAEGNNVSLLVLGSATHGLAMQRLVATVPVKVAMHAPCSVLLVKQAAPFAQLGREATA